MVFPIRRATMASLDEVGATTSSDYAISKLTIKPQRHTMSLRHQDVAYTTNSEKEDSKSKQEVTTRSHKNVEGGSSSLTAEAKSGEARSPPAKALPRVCKESAKTPKKFKTTVRVTYATDSDSEPENTGGGFRKIRARTTTFCREITDYVSKVIFPDQSAASTTAGSSLKRGAPR